MTDCTPYIDDLKAYADGELSWPRRHIVRRHLTHCASCQEEIAAMTQISEDLRSDEPAEMLPASLRGKLLEAPGTESAGLPENESASGTEDAPMRVKKRRAPVWVYACVALVAWFTFYPIYQKTRSIQGVPERMASVMQSSPHESEIKVFKRLPPANATGSFSPAAPASLQVHLSDREAGTDNSSAKALYAPSAVSPGLRESAVRRAAVTNNGPRAALPFDSNGNASSNLLNGDPDSLRQVHKEASIGIQVPNPEAAGDKLNQMVQETGGYVAANNLSTDPDGLRSGELIVKVPEPQFETFLAQVTKLGVVVSKNITGQDITEKTSDAREAQDVEESDLTQAEARLKALGTHAKWDDTQNAEDLRVQLAQTRARLKLLKRMAALGTITIDLNQTPKAAAALPATTGFTGSLKATTHDALQSLVGSASALAALVIWLLAYAPVWVPLLLLGRYALKQYKKREAAS